MTPVDAPVVPRHLRELAELTGDDDGAQRVAWTERWVTARDWLRGQLAEIPGVEVHTDPAGNIWATLPGESERSVVVGGHLDSVPNGGWLDGALNVTAALEVLRAVAGGPRPALTLRLVDWADEEGARFGRSLVGSSACAGTLDPDVAARPDATATASRCPTRSPPRASTSTACSRPAPSCATSRPTWSCTSSRGRCSSASTGRSGW